jgi:ferredoxin
MPSYAITGNRPDENAAATKERYARRDDAGQGDEENQLQWVLVPTRDRGGCAGCGACITAI